MKVCCNSPKEGLRPPAAADGGEPPPPAPDSSRSRASPALTYNVCPNHRTST